MGAWDSDPVDYTVGNVLAPVRTGTVLVCLRCVKLNKLTTLGGDIWSQRGGGHSMSAATSQRKQEAQMQAKDQLKQRLEQSTRTQRIILFPLTLAAVGGLAMLFSINRTEFVGAISSWESRQYDPELGLKIAISGCDVTLSEGTSPTIVYTSIVGAWSFAWRYAAGTSMVEQWFGTGSAVDIDARNAWDDCAAAPFHDCAVLCHVMVSVPPEATNVSITVEQVADDAASLAA